MPVVVDSVQGPALWAPGNGTHVTGFVGDWATGNECLRLALVNNMPDAALQDTEQQFFRLLDAVSEGLLVRVKLISLPAIPRGEQGRDWLGQHYFGVEELWRSPLDAAIVTGTEPHYSNLRHEPYWAVLTDVLDWAQDNTVSTILSCLAAHASVLHCDGIERHRLCNKRFGVFEVSRAGDHTLTARVGNRWNHWRFPHSRWNEVRGEELASCGYVVLGRSEDAGVDLFVKKTRNSFFLHFQGHPEYDRLTLFREYRRDTRRFLKGISETYPSLPKGYFGAEAVGLLSEFRANALMNRSESLMADFPDAPIARALKKTWHLPATRVYRNWLHYLVSRKTDGVASEAAVGATVGGVQ